MCFSSPDTGGGAPPPPPAPVREPIRRAARLPDEAVGKARTEERSRAQLAFARRGGTLITGPGGLQTTASTQKATLLGQV